MMMMERIDLSTGNLKKFDKKRFKDLGAPLIMGILNVTPDSFSDGGRHNTLETAVDHALKMIEDGADIIDVGGESTRPFAESIITEEEVDRTIPVIKALVDRIDIPISIDTRHVEVARKALDAGAVMVNDVNSLGEPGMEELVIERDVSAVLMHMKGEPGNMQIDPTYRDVVSEVLAFLEGRIVSFENKGGNRERLIVDPGIGFGKRVEDNLVLLRDLDRFLDLDCPVMVGASRKSFIGKVLDLEVDERLEGSLAAAIVAYNNGASILRVHDVKETRRALDLARAIMIS
jgi:dihydropteroate synthase